MSRFHNLEFGEHSDEGSEGRWAAKDEPYYLNEAEGAFAQGRFEQALRAYAKVLEFNPKNASAWTGQVRMLIELGEFREAKLWADKALESFPEEPELLAAKAVALARAGDLSAALVFSDAAIAALGDRPYVWLSRGDVLLARKEKRAEFCFEKALGLAPAGWLVPWLISRVYYFHRQFARALKAVQQAMALDAAQAVLWLQCGRCQRALGLVGAAGHSFEQARQLDPQCAPDASELAAGGLWAGLKGLGRRWFRP